MATLEAFKREFLLKHPPSSRYPTHQGASIRWIPNQGRRYRARFVQGIAGWWYSLPG